MRRSTKINQTEGSPTSVMSPKIGDWSPSRSKQYHRRRARKAVDIILASNKPGQEETIEAALSTGTLCDKMKNIRVQAASDEVETSLPPEHDGLAGLDVLERTSIEIPYLILDESYDYSDDGDDSDYSFAHDNLFDIPPPPEIVKDTISTAFFSCRNFPSYKPSFSSYGKR
eukprot:CAMPEP_0198292780 /NCGR_PEP_ID=MMETSP1449-20131203/13890_1 /TAXON_ID=420275 /ORGANISM="Attheya septentrionalis, Strain CCMP2084" /LENGTH=170 /DNA_ID=CAMNT_0043992079 /DNA_START=27 /DNA_END=539 /DNA_ORIENTATION=+